ncbi:MAG: FAD:protein FMN transferase [Pseudoflavonifractor sp.]|nr:FAD:protein FMN transferase [Pseudoflavonifractor sp.]
MGTNRLTHCAVVAILAVVGAATGGCGRESYREMSGAVWGTTYSIIYRSDKALDDSVRAEMRRVEQSLSMFSDSSTVSRVNRGETSVTDPLFAEVFAEARRVSAASGGAFDPTVAPLVELWGFGRGKVSGTPSPQAIDSVLAAVGIADCRMEGLTVVRKHSGTQFDFSAIAKGYGCDRVAAMLRRNGCADYMVEIGGEITVGGASPRGDRWRVMIDAPVEGDVPVHERLAVIEPPEGGVATSGNYRNYRDTPDGRIGHTIDPATGRPRLTRTLSATVTAPACMTADALATACMAMEPDSALAMVERMAGVEALVVTRDSAGGMAVRHTVGFPPMR